MFKIRWKKENMTHILYLVVVRGKIIEQKKEEGKIKEKKEKSAEIQI